MSTGFWLPDRPLTLQEEAAGRHYYVYPGLGGVRRLRYVGATEPLLEIREDQLVRVSLARWWQPDDDPAMELRCYLQLSGSYEG
jgi:hypothetical protein